MISDANSALSKLYYGDNLAVLRNYIADQSVDLVYLDPPFNSRQDYNVLFAEKDGHRSAAQTCWPTSPWLRHKNNLDEEHAPRHTEGAHHRQQSGLGLTNFNVAQLSVENKYQFQYWALGLCGARPTEGIKKGADRGIDGRSYFHDDNSGDSKQIIFSVKGGHNIGVSEVRDLIGVLQREKAEIGVYISFEEPTKPMLREAAEAGFYTSPDSSKYPRVQLLTVKDLIEGNKSLQRPLHVRDVTFKKAPRSRPAAAENLSLPLG